MNFYALHIEIRKTLLLSNSTLCLSTILSSRSLFSSVPFETSFFVWSARTEDNRIKNVCFSPSNTTTRFCVRIYSRVYWEFFSAERIFSLLVVFVIQIIDVSMCVCELIQCVCVSNNLFNCICFKNNLEQNNIIFENGKKILTQKSKIMFLNIYIYPFSY